MSVLSTNSVGHIKERERIISGTICYKIASM